MARDAQAALNKADWPSAIKQYSALVKTAPVNAEYVSNLGIAYYRSGQPDEAIVSLRRALKLSPASGAIQQYLGASLAETGQCPAAMPYLKKSAARTGDDHIRRASGVDRVRCAMALNQVDEAAEAMRVLSRDFPGDPDVLYLATHIYSDLSIRASQELLFKAPGSYQVHQLNAEALEVQGKWQEAAQEYRAALQNNPQAPGIHYLLGRLLLSQLKTPTTMEDARKEFEEELKINPANAGAEFVLGELARQDEKWPDAIAHFTRSTRLDAGFADAFLGLGRTLLAADRAAEAVPSLEDAVKLQPANPMTHFQLAIAYRRVGRKADADREALAHQQTSANARETKDQIQKGVSGQVR